MAAKYTPKFDHTLVNEIRDYLKSKHMCKNEIIFASNWLGQSDSYLRMARHKRIGVSIGAYATLAVKLETIGNKLVCETNPTLLAIGNDLLTYAKQCQDEVVKESLIATGDVDFTSPSFINTLETMITEKQ